MLFHARSAETEPSSRSTRTTAQKTAAKYGQFASAATKRLEEIGLKMCGAAATTRTLWLLFRAGTMRCQHMPANDQAHPLCAN